MEENTQLFIPDQAPQKSNKQLRKIAKWVYYDMFYTSTLEMAGSQKATYLEKMSEGKEPVANQNWAFRILNAIFLLILTVFPLLTVMQLLEQADASTIPLDHLIVNGTLAMLLYCGLMVVYLILFGLLTLAGMFGAKSFDWLTTLPLTLGEIRKISFYTFFRGFNLQMLALFLCTPLSVIIAMIIRRQLLLLPFVLSLGMSFVLLVVSLWGLIFTSTFLHKKLVENQDSDKKSTLVRILSVGTYTLGTFGIIILLQYLTPLLTDLPGNIWFDDNLIEILLPLFSFLPTLTAPVVLFVGGFTPAMFGDPMLLVFLIIGLLLSYPVCKKIYEKTLDQFYKATIEKIQVKSEGGPEVTLEDVQIETRSPIKAFIRKDLLSLTKDMNVLMMAIMTWIFPLLTLFVTDTSMIDDPEIAAFSLMFTLVIYVAMGTFMFNIALNYLDSDVNNLNASLPLIVREQVIGRVGMAAVVLIPSALPASIILAILQNNPIFLWYQFVFIGIYFTYILLMIMLKTAFFGKINDVYTLSMVSMNNKTLKWIIYYVIVIAIIFGDMVLFVIIGRLPMPNALLLNAGIRWGVVLILAAIAAKLYPRPKLTES